MKLSEISGSFHSLEVWIEDWLDNDVSELACSVLVMDWQVRTSFGACHQDG